MAGLVSVLYLYVFVISMRTQYIIGKEYTTALLFSVFSLRISHTIYAY